MKALFYPLIFLMLIFIKPSYADTILQIDTALQGKIVRKISFLNSTNLSWEDLAREFSFSVGEVLQPGQLIAAVQGLKRRAIFSQVDLEAKLEKDRVSLIFILSPETFITDIVFSGGGSIERKLLQGIAADFRGRALQLASVKENDPQRNLSRGSLVQLRQALGAVLTEAGYFRAKPKFGFTNSSGDSYLSLAVEMNEGSRTSISEVIVPPGIPPDLEQAIEKAVAGILDKVASRKNLDLLRQQLLLACRNEGYLQASIPSPVLALSDDRKTATVSVEISYGDPITIVFRGNKHLDPEELLAPLEIQTRKVPFSPSAVRNLSREIERLYQAEGYLNSKVSFAKLPARGTRRIYEITIDEGERLKLDSFRFQGNSFASSDYLASLFKSISEEGLIPKVFKRKKIVKDLIAKDLDRLEDFYRSSGFFEIKAEVEYIVNGDELDLVVNIQEGERLKIENSQVLFSNTSMASGLSNIVSILPPDVAYHAKSIEEERKRILKKVRSKGFPLAVVKARLQKIKKNLVFEVEQGQQVVVGKISLQGNLHTHDEVVYRALVFEEGDPWKVAALKQSRKNLYGLGHFLNVSIEAADGKLDSDQEDILVKVRERETGSIKIGAGYHTEDGFRLLSELRQANLFGNGNTATIGFDSYFNEGPRVVDAGNARALYRVPNLSGSAVEMLLESFYRFQIQLIDQFSYDRAGGEISFRYPFEERVSASAGLLAYYEEVFDVQEDVVISDLDQGAHNFSFLESAVEVDFRNDPFNPSAGGRTILSASLSDKYLGSDASFAHFMFRQSYFKRLYSGLIFASSVKGEIFSPYGETDSVPLSQRIFLGGRNSLRGFRLSSVGPQGLEGHAIGGDRSIVLNTELQLDLTEELAAVFFLDAGQTFIDNKGSFEGEETKFSDLRYSPGLGLRYKTPIGPISLDYGIALDRREKEDFGRINVGIGLIF